MTEIVLECEQPLCPKCGNSKNVVCCGWSENHKNKRYLCKECMAHFRYPKLEVKIVDENEGLVACPKCGSKDLWRHGRTTDKRRRYECKICKKFFVYPSYIELPKAPLVFPAGVKRIRQKDDVECVIGVPCFACDLSDKCAVTDCIRLDKWLLEQGTEMVGKLTAGDVCN